MKSLLPTSWGESGTLRSLQDEIERIFSQYSGDLPTPFRFGEVRFPAIDVTETEDAVEVSAELPGVKREDIDISLAGRSLVIKGEKKNETERRETDKALDRHVVERSYGSFRRVVPLDFDADPDKIAATFEDGVLKLRVEKPEDVVAKASKIEISDKPAA